MAGRVLIVEDDELMGSSLCRALVASGYDAVHAASLAAARRQFAAHRPQLVLLDVALPDGDGLDWCTELHASDRTLPIMMLTARSEEVDVVVGLSAGAVDYVSKPFRLAELTARVEAHLRRASALDEVATTATESDACLFVGDVRVDLRGRRVLVDGTEVDLRQREFDLLARLVMDAGSVVRREVLMSEVWDEHWFGSTKTLDVHIAQLRRKLGESTGSRSRITSVRGVGYRFEPGAGDEAR